MRKFWFLFLFSLVLVSPAFVGCGGGPTSQESAREQVERDRAEEAASGEEEDEERDD